MRSVLITPHNKVEFDLAFELLTDFADGRRPLSWEGKGEIGFAFLMKEKENINTVTEKVESKKTIR